MRVLVTSGAGYIGSAVVEELLAQEHAPTIMPMWGQGGRGEPRPC
jgi:UDP-glucose 4-epimerase